MKNTRTPHFCFSNTLEIQSTCIELHILFLYHQISPNFNISFSESKSRQQCVKWVIDMTLAYPDGEGLDMPGMMVGWHKPRDMRVHWRAYPVSDLPSDIEGRTKWLYDRYVEKEHHLEQFYSKGQDFNDSDVQTRSLPRITTRKVPFDTVSYIFAYAFYAISAFFFWLFIYCPVWNGLLYLVSYLF